jgi:two-component system, sensor histidine kinase and response regulator
MRPQPMVDLDALMDRVDGDRELLKEMVVVFLEGSGSNMETFRSALESRDLPRLAASAHALKGCVANFSTRGAFETVSSLEALAKHGDVEAAREQYAQLSRQVEQLCGELSKLAHT